MTAVQLGRVLGLVLDRSTRPEPGNATVVHVDVDGSADPCRVHWRSAEVWRVQTRRGTQGSDGTTTWSDTDPAHPTRPGHPPWHLMPVFPLRAPVWGRSSDDYFPAAARREGAGARLSLQGTEDDREASLLIDPLGFLIEVAFAGGTRLELRDVDLRPQPDSLFVRP